MDPWTGYKWIKKKKTGHHVSPRLSPHQVIINKKAQHVSPRTSKLQRSVFAIFIYFFIKHFKEDEVLKMQLKLDQLWKANQWMFFVHACVKHKFPGMIKAGRRRFLRVPKKAECSRHVQGRHVDKQIWSQGNCSGSRHEANDVYLEEERLYIRKSCLNEPLIEITAMTGHTKLVSTLFYSECS